MPYEAGAGYQRGGDTSHAAARDIAATLPQREKDVLDLLSSAVGPMTADEVAARLRWDITSVRPRLTGLCDKGRIEIVPDRKGKTRHGKSCALWRPVRPAVT